MIRKLLTLVILAGAGAYIYYYYKHYLSTGAVTYRIVTPKVGMQ